MAIDSNTTADASPDAATVGTETIVLIHGLISHPWIMKPLEWRFRQAGFATRNWGYRSLSQSNADHARAFAEYLHTVDAEPTMRRFHIVAHSMGSIIIRCVLQHHQFHHLGRVVMLCPPNRGSHMARRASHWIGQRIRTLAEISDATDSFVNQLPPATRAQVGIVIASGDRVIYGDATRLDDAIDYATVPGMHNAVLFKRRVVELCTRFLRTGKFSCSIASTCLNPQPNN